MAVTSKIYGRVFLAAFNKEINFLSDTIRVTLHTSTYTPDQDVHDYQNDVTNELATGGGYTSGGATLASKTLTYTNATNVVMFDAADVQWASSTLTWRTAVVVDVTPGTTATNPLLCYHQSDVDIVSTGGNTDIIWNANGIMTITVA